MLSEMVSISSPPKLLLPAFETELEKFVVLLLLLLLLLAAAAGMGTGGGLDRATDGSGVGAAGLLGDWDFGGCDSFGGGVAGG
jgi:hypothetical protein